MTCYSGLGAKFTEAANNIKKLLQKYETKQPGEPNSIANLSESNMKSWRIKQKIRYAQVIMTRLNFTGEDKKQVVYLITEIQDTNKLCKKCSYETIITALCFYVKFSNTRKYPLNRYVITKEVGLTEEVYGRIVTKLCKHFQAKGTLSHTRYV